MYLSGDSSARRARNTLVLWVLAACALALCVLLAWPFLAAIGGAFVLAVAFYPLHAFVAPRARRPALAALISTLAVLVLVLIPTITIAVTGVRELREAYAHLNRRGNQEGGLVAYLDLVLEPPIARIAAWTGVPAAEIRGEVISRLNQAGAAAVRFVTQTVAALTASILQVTIAFFTLFFLFRDGPQWVDRMARLLPMEEAVATRLSAHVSQTIIANVYGVLSVSAVQGFLLATGFYLAGLPSPVMWGVITGFASLIPMVGSALVWLPASLIVLAAGETGKGLFLLAWGAGLVAASDNIIRPMIIGGRTHLNSLLIFFSLVGGIQYFGFVGLFLGPVIVSVAVALVGLIEETLPDRAAGP